jgi:CubicO group peptidase (beta-lactamase class C family)|eukprot:g1561.t1
MSFSPEKLSLLSSWVKRQNSDAFVIVHKGKVIFEKYYKGRTRETKTDVFSASKSVLSLLVGIALQNGKLQLDDPVQKFTKHVGKPFSNSPQTEGLITVRHLLTMTSGLDDSMSYKAEPGRRWHYNLGTAWHLVKTVLENAYDDSLQSISDRTLFNPIGIFSATWKSRPAGTKVFDGIVMYLSVYWKDLLWKYGSSVWNLMLTMLSTIALSNRGASKSLRFLGAGATWGSYVAASSFLQLRRDYKNYSAPRKFFDKPTTSLHASALDCARIGMLVLNRGTWVNGKPIVDSSYIVDKCSRPSTALNPAYSFLFWINGQGFHVDPMQIFSEKEPERIGGFLIPSAPKDLVAAMGFGVQRIYIVPSKDLVVVRLGESPSSEAHAAGAPFDNQLWEKIMRLFFSAEVSDTPRALEGTEFVGIATEEGLSPRL